MNYATLTSDRVFLLSDCRGVKSVIKLERVEPMTVDAGSISETVSFDRMLDTWIGGSAIVNSFRLTGVPGGTYDLYLYAAEVVATTDFYLSINGGASTMKSATPTIVDAYVEGDNYVRFGSMVLPDDSTLTILVVGYLAGLQLHRP
jgi:hypothetical protein